MSDLGNINGSTQVWPGNTWPCYPMPRQGWQCPGCSRCYSPDTTMCYYCGSTVWTVYPQTTNPLPTININTQEAAAGAECQRSAGSTEVANQPSEGESIAR